MPILDSHSSSSDRDAGHPRQSYLDAAVHSAIDPIAREIFTPAKAQVVEDEVTHYGKAFIKTAPLFMKGKLALGGLALTYVADQAKIGDSLQNQVTDATLGLGKAAVLKGSFALMESSALTPARAGIQLGIVSRTAEAGLTRENYLDKDGKLNFTGGLSTTFKTALNPGSLAVDALTFGAADVVWGRMYQTSRGAIRFDSAMNKTIQAGTMGAAAGAGNELVRQWQSDEKFNLSLIIGRGLADGAVGAAAGRVGGMQSARYDKIGAKDSPTALGEARQTPFQLGKIGDSQQIALRDGVFTPTREIGDLMTTTWKGTLTTAEGQVKPVLFRPDTGIEAFAYRKQSEIAGYGLGTKLDFANSIPVSVARSVEINGKTHSGYIQEINGKNLLEVVDPHGPRKIFTPPSKKVLDDFRQNKPLFEAYQEAWVKRLIMGEWDNHILNFVSEKTPAGTTVKNIDVGDGLRPATTQADLIPRPGQRRGYENLNQYLYNEATNVPLPQQTVAKVRQFVDTYNNPAGKTELQGLGLTQQQVEGVMGRADWFAKHGRLPKGDAEPTTYRFAQRLYQYLRGRNPTSRVDLHSLGDQQ
ncbi:MAG: hypothetical protein WC028_10230 [Candidatus Obscuribacterales bacterium]